MVMECTRFGLGTTSVMGGIEVLCIVRLGALFDRALKYGIVGYFIDFASIVCQIYPVLSIQFHLCSIQWTTFQIARRAATLRQ